MQRQASSVCSACSAAVTGLCDSTARPSSRRTRSGHRSSSHPRWRDHRVDGPVHGNDSHCARRQLLGPEECAPRPPDLAHLGSISRSATPSKDWSASSATGDKAVPRKPEPTMCNHSPGAAGGPQQHDANELADQVAVTRQTIVALEANATPSLALALRIANSSTSPSKKSSGSMNNSTTPRGGASPTPIFHTATRLLSKPRRRRLGGRTQKIARLAQVGSRPSMIAAEKDGFASARPCDGSHRLGGERLWSK